MNAADMAQVLETGLQTGELAVEYFGDCAAKSWTVTWIGIGGNKPNMVINGSNLGGFQVQVNTTELQQGGLLRVLTGEFLRTPETSPQVSLPCSLLVGFGKSFSRYALPLSLAWFVKA